MDEYSSEKAQMPKHSARMAVGIILVIVLALGAALWGRVFTGPARPTWQDIKQNYDGLPAPKDMYAFAKAVRETDVKNWRGLVLDVRADDQVEIDMNADNKLDVLYSPATEFPNLRQGDQIQFSGLMNVAVDQTYLLLYVCDCVTLGHP